MPACDRDLRNDLKQAAEELRRARPRPRDLKAGELAGRLAKILDNLAAGTTEPDRETAHTFLGVARKVLRAFKSLQ